jgi:EAL domain-containing protein (putative c-di-GMP-specific phosphodiesterase class I)
LSSFVHLPFDKIKIDRSFVGCMQTSPGAAAIVSAIAGLGLRLQMTTTAEGVETIEQLEYLRAAGCTEAQGYYFSAARPNAEVPALLATLGSASLRSGRAILA